MAREVQASEAETRLHQLLDEVEQVRPSSSPGMVGPSRELSLKAHLRQQEIDQAIEDIKELGKKQARSPSKKFSPGVTQVISIDVLWRPWMRRSRASRTPKWCC